MYPFDSEKHAKEGKKLQNLNISRTKFFRLKHFSWFLKDYLVKKQKIVDTNIEKIVGNI